LTVAEQLGDEVARILPRLRIDELLDELQTRLGTVRSSRDRVSQLLEAVVGIGSGLDLEQALTRIVQASANLVDAQYGVLGVLDGGQRLSRFVTFGMSDEQIAAIGHFPEGHGLLGELIRDPAPLRADDLAAHPRSSGFPANHPPMRSFLGVPVRVRDEIFGNLYLTEKRGGAPFDADDEAVLTALAAAAGVAIDNARLYDEARRRQEWLEITGDLSRGLLSSEDPDDVLAAFVRRARVFARADLALVAIPEAEGSAMLIVAADGYSAERVRGEKLGIEDTLVGHVYTTGQRALVEDMHHDDRADPRATAELGLGPALIVPLGAGGQARGAVSLSRLAGSPPFDPGLEDLTAELAVQAAVVLELAERRRDSELLSLYADRDRIGRDLHDLAIQRLFATSMSLQGAYKITEKPTVARRIATAISDLDDTIKVIRSTIFALHSHGRGGDVLGVRAQVIEVCEQGAGALGFTPGVRFTGPVDSLVGWQIAEQLLAVLREALSNTARHAKATRVDLDLAADSSTVTLTVADDGTGLPADGHRSGLANLAERAAQLGGTFAAQPGPTGTGTVLTWAVPTSFGRFPESEVPIRTVRKPEAPRG
jgi:signal transduction histidine kinase